MEPLGPWLQEHLLSVIVLVLTLLLIAHYLLERVGIVRLSKRYRNSLYEAQSKIFLNATQHLISGNKDLAIKEFINAVNINRETIETYFALGALFRSNGEIEKAVSIHRSLIAKENINEATRLRSLKELALDFEKGGLLDKAIESYKDALIINRDQKDVLQALCRIYEDIQDWDEAYHYRIILSKISQEDQSETISHILVEKAKKDFERNDLTPCHENLEDAFRFSPSIPAKILKLKLLLRTGDLERSKFLLVEVLKEHPVYASFVFESLSDVPIEKKKEKAIYKKRLQIIKDYFLRLEDDDLLATESVILSKVRLFKDLLRLEEATETLQEWMKQYPNSTEIVKKEYIKFLIELGKNDEALAMTKELIHNLDQLVTKHFCGRCGHGSDEIFWRCPQCRTWETIQFRWKL